MQKPAPDGTTYSKAQWRQWAKQIRAQSPDNSLKIQQNLANWLNERNYTEVLGYRAMANEVSLEALPQMLPMVQLYTTCSHYKPEPHLTVHPWHSAQQRRRGILEPLVTAEALDPKCLQVVLVPALAFDRAGYRLGYGMGFYDRFLNLLANDCIFIGIVSETCYVEQLPREPHDRAVHYIATEQGIAKVEQAG